MQRIRTLILASLWLASQAALAQWQWLDKDGRKVFSDRAPPAEVPARNILKQPGRAALAASPPAAPVAAASAAAAPAESASTGPAAPQLGRQDSDLEAGKKKAEAEKAAKAKAEAERVASAKASNCAQAKQKQALMDSGVRVSITNAQGEREILDDAARAAENKRIRSVMDADCK